MNEKQRVALLGGAAFLLVAFLGIRMFRGNGASDDDNLPTAKRVKPDVSAVFSATVSHDRNALDKRYKPIVDIDPFKTRAFRPKRSGNGGRDPESDPEPLPRNGSDPEPPPFTGGVWLRFTGIIDVGTSCEAVLEDRPNNKGLFAHAGEHFGDKVVANVTSTSIIFDISGTAPVGTTSKTLEVGDRLAFTLSAVPLKPFAFISSSASASIAAKSSGLPPLDEKQTMTILERLRQRARKSRGVVEVAPVESATQAGSSSPPAQTAKEPAAPETSATPTSPNQNVTQPATPAESGNK